jgi:hypothetical protein
MKNAKTIPSLVGPLLRNFLAEQLITLGCMCIELGRVCNKLAKSLIDWD